MNAYFTNVLAEKRIRDLQDLTRIELIHSFTKWKWIITANIWTYEMRMVNDALNKYPIPQESTRRTPDQTFPKTNLNINTKHYKSCGWPVYLLDANLQQNNQHHKWKESATVCIYLVKSPQHGINISLVLILATWLVSPKFHAKHDPLFDIMKQESFKSNWQNKAGFVAKRKQHISSIRNKFTRPKAAKPNGRYNNAPSLVSKNRRSSPFADTTRTK